MLSVDGDSLCFEVFVCVLFISKADGCVQKADKMLWVLLSYVILKVEWPW